ncbi:MAG: hypothetical protein NTU58_00005 [Candidatus Nealsonbacteria bacterium]|nr:hypothetical protein [Candidatus Nealsonbacteria bacterium]
MKSKIEELFEEGSLFLHIKEKLPDANLTVGEMEQLAGMFLENRSPCPAIEIYNFLGRPESLKELLQKYIMPYFENGSPHFAETIGEEIKVEMPSKEILRKIGEDYLKKGWCGAAVKILGMAGVENEEKQRLFKLYGCQLGLG